MNIESVSGDRRVLSLIAKVKKLESEASSYQTLPLSQALRTNDAFEHGAQCKHDPNDGLRCITEPYPPCTKPLDELEPIKVLQMKLETHHRGKMLMARATSVGQRHNFACAVVEDLDEDCVPVLMNFQTNESDEPAKHLIPKHCVFIIKEPFTKYQTALNDSFCISIEHVSDIVWLGDGDERIPEKWRRPLPTIDIEHDDLQYRQVESRAFWHEKKRLYDIAIQTAVTSKEKELAHMGRAYINIQLGRAEEAIEDIKAIGNISDPSALQIHLDATAHCRVGDFYAGLSKLRQIKKEHPEWAFLQKDFDRIKVRIGEQEFARYDFNWMYKQALKAAKNVQQRPFNVPCRPIVDCATWRKLVEVRPSPGRGRGLFLKESVPAGGLVLCESAFAYAQGNDADFERGNILINVNTGRATLSGQKSLLSQLVQKVYHNPKQAREFYDLYDGGYKRTSESLCDGVPVVDTFLIERIMSLNAIGCPIASREKILGGYLMNPSHPNSGLWILASYINHDCLGNCRPAFIGDMLILRATRPIAADEELLFPYYALQPPAPYSTLKQALSKWGFACTCDCCKIIMNTSEEVQKKRSLLYEKLMALVELGDKCDVQKTLKGIRKLEATYPKPYPVGLQRAAAEAYSPLTWRYLNGRSNPTRAIESAIKGLEAMAFELIAWPYAEGAQGKPPRFEITRWGYVNIVTCSLLYRVLKPYMAPGSSLARVAKDYMFIFCGIITGDPASATSLFEDIQW